MHVDNKHANTQDNVNNLTHSFSNKTSPMLVWFATGPCKIFKVAASVLFIHLLSLFVICRHVRPYITTTYI